MGTSNNPLAPNPVTDIDSPEVRKHIAPDAEEPPDEDLGEGVPVGEEGNVEYERGRGSSDGMDRREG
jgi:hypothetical protein